MMPSIAISIPAYNEEMTIASVVSESLTTLQNHTDDFEVVVINDGSTDNTGRIIQELAEKDPHIRIVHHEKNLGFGQTMKDVWNSSQKDWIFFIPADGQIPASELATLWPWHDQADFILGWRKERRDPWFRRVMAFQYNILIRAITGQHVHDIDSVTLIRTAVLRQIQLQSNSPFIHAECYLKASRLRIRMMEVPIKHIARLAGQARGVSMRNVGKTFRDFARYMSNRLDDKST